MGSASKNTVDRKFEELFRTWFSSLSYFAQKYIRDLDTCKEIVHQVFINIWEKRDAFDFDKPAKSYLFTAVYNRCLNHIRDSKKFVDSSSIAAALEDNIIASVNQDHLESAEMESHIWEVINSLPEKCREVFIMNRFDGKKYSEIADELGISVKTVETQMSKALKVLRDQLICYIHVLIYILIKLLW